MNLKQRKARAEQEHPFPPAPPKKSKGKLAGVIAAGLIGLALVFFAFSGGKGELAGITAPGQFISSDISEGTRDVTFRVADEAARGAVQLWDWGDEDGDAVQVTGQVVNLRHQPQAVPVSGMDTVEVLGVRDGYGGITVGVAAPGCVPAVRVMHIRPGETGHIYFK